MQALKPQEAAQLVFHRLVKDEKDREYVKHIGKLYSGSDYEPSAAASAVFFYGLSVEWLRPDNPNAQQELRSALRILFDIDLKKNGALPAETTFISTLGALINDLVLTNDEQGAASTINEQR